MASGQGASTSVKFELSPRDKLYLKISENLSEDQVKSLRLLLHKHIPKAKIANETPQAIFHMLEADNIIGEANCGLLKELLVALKETNLAKEVEDLERDERREMRKRKASSDDDSPAGPYYRNLRGMRGRSGMRDRETGKFESDILRLHSKLGFRVEELEAKEGGKTTHGSSIPLILPNDLKYNASTGRVVKVHGVRRESLQVVPEALELLEGIEEPVSVISICGPCRTGKSYILSRLLGTADSFQLGHLADPQTIGIWMGTKVLRGKDFTIVLLDTEGIDAVGGSAGQDASILVMTILLSSYLIYNSLNVPLKGDLEKMQCFIQLAKGLTVKQGEEKIQTSAFHEFFPDFLWLLRDASLKMQDKDGKDMTPTEYLVTKVLGRDPDDFFESTSDTVGRVILSFFPSVECTTLERPSEKKHVMNNIAQHTDSLNPEFNKGVENLTKWLLRKSRAKRGYDKASTVSGVALSIMTKQYVDAVNDPNAIPALDNTWQTTIELMQNKAVEEAVTEYNKQMQSQIATATNNGQDPLEENPENETPVKPVTRGRGRYHTRSSARGGQRHSKSSFSRNPPSQPSLMILHSKLLNDITDTLLEKVGHFGTNVGDRSSEKKIVVERMQTRLVQREERSVEYVEADGTTRKQEGFVVTGGELLYYIQQNKELSKGFCKDLFNRLLNPIKVHVESPSPDYDFEKLIEEMADARQQYSEQARGPEKWVVLQEMTHDIERLKTKMEKIKGYESKKMQEQQEAHEAELKATKMAREMRQLRKQANDLQQTQQKNLQKMERLHREQIKKMKLELEERLKVEVQKIKDLQAANMEKQAKTAEERLEKESSKTREMIQRMEQERADISRQLKEMKDRDKKQPTLDLHEHNQQLQKQAQVMQKTQQETLQKIEQQNREQMMKMKQELEEQHATKLQEIQYLQNAKLEEQAKMAKEHLEEMIQRKEQERAVISRQLQEQSSLIDSLLQRQRPPTPPPLPTPPRPQPPTPHQRRKNRCTIS